MTLPEYDRLTIVGELLDVALVILAKVTPQKVMVGTQPLLEKQHNYLWLLPLWLKSPKIY